MRRVQLKQNRYRSPSFGDVSISTLKWNVSEGDHDENSESLYLVMTNVKAMWDGENPTASEAWEGENDYPNGIWDLYDWDWPTTRDQLALLQTKLAAVKQTSPRTVAYFDSLMAQNAATKKFMVSPPQEGAEEAPLPEPPPSAITTRPLPWLPIIGGVSVLGIILVLLMRKK